ncbi:hypothetical protein GRI58_02390 [Porphyrobacter algicida]|uniref:Response regulatory domain-containing protein n=1 Tax=Qipengyuania algicida TaxID=1836209 RepID=A0A845ABP9_9SPHN|nr:hypothetical protein [Qipengyuania algicida]MXP27670.1 hypothetical protein [Qipengyuania algicida]
MLEAMELAGVEPPPSVTIIDDDPEDREDLMDLLRDHGIEPRPVNDRYGQDIDRLVADILAIGSSFVICDYRLQPKNFASFSGSKVVRRLGMSKQPAMLLTMYQSNNRLELRQERADMPVVVSRRDFEVERLGDYAEICRREFSDNPIDQRRPHRSLIAIRDIRNNHGPTELDVVIPNWRPDESIILPELCLAPGVTTGLEVGDYLLGDVNVGAEDEDDLFFRNVNEVIKACEISDL